MLNKIKELRKEKKISQEKLASNLSVTQTTISKWENGERIPDAETINRLANYFDVSADYLLNRQNAYKMLFNYLSDEEIEIITLYRTLNPLNQKECLGFLKGLIARDSNINSIKSQ